LKNKKIGTDNIFFSSPRPILSPLSPVLWTLDMLHACTHIRSVTCDFCQGNVFHVLRTRSDFHRH
jgi:hypothetical protein